MSTIWGAGWVGRESSPGDKRILKPTIPGSQGQASSTPTHSVLIRKGRTCIKLVCVIGHIQLLLPWACLVGFTSLKPLPCGALISESDGQWTKPISPSFFSLKHTHTHSTHSSIIGL